MTGRCTSSRGPHLGGRRTIGAFAALLFATVLVGIPTEPAAHAALSGLTNFEIDGNLSVEGPSPPSGGAGIDWVNAAAFLQNVAQPLDSVPCGTNPDTTTLNVKLNDWNPFNPVLQSSNV